jgi:lysophospholipase L1-like esterase
MKPKRLLIAVIIPVLALAVIWIVIRSPFSADHRLTTIICMGDSLTESDFGYYPKHLKGLLKRRGVHANVVTAARPGHTSGEYLDFLMSSAIIQKFKPDMAIVMLGTNDVRVDRDHTPLYRYRENMIRIINRIKAGRDSRRSGPVIFLASIPPIFKIDLNTFDETSRDRVETEIVPAIHELARQEKVHLIDIHGFFKKRPELMSGIHPWKRGYFAMAEFIFNSILPSLEAE